jgi:hypothetical protein
VYAGTAALLAAGVNGIVPALAAFPVILGLFTLYEATQQ